MIEIMRILANVLRDIS